VILLFSPWLSVRVVRGEKKEVRGEKRGEINKEQ